MNMSYKGLILGEMITTEQIECLIVIFNYFNQLIEVSQPMPLYEGIVAQSQLVDPPLKIMVPLTTLIQLDRQAALTSEF